MSIERPLTRLSLLTRRRWAIPLLGELHRLDGAKFVTLCSRLDVNPGAMRQSLDHLLEIGLVERNPGYGHPLRPEYILTREGAEVAPTCARLDGLLKELRLRELGLRRWSLPVLRTLGELRGSTRFSILGQRLVGVTDRALSLTLRELVGADLVAREVVDAAPPSTAYSATRTARPLVRLALGL